MITLTDCSRRFQDKKKVVKAVRDVSLTIEKGEVVGILGENGLKQNDDAENDCFLA